jgi:hypothetical protein
MRYSPNPAHPLLHFGPNYPSAENLSDRSDPNDYADDAADLFRQSLSSTFYKIAFKLIF